MFHSRCARAFTLVELMITLAVLAILAAVAAPTFNEFFERARLRSATEEIVSFLSNARQESVKRDRDVTVAVGGTASAWCLGAIASPNPAVLGDPVVESPAPCNCDGAPGACLIGGEQHVMNGSGGTSITGDNAFTFSSKLGALADLSAVGDPIVVTSKSGDYEMQVTVTALGHARACVPTDKTAIPGVKTCS